MVSCGVLFLLMIALEWSEIRENSNWQTEKNEEKTELCKYMDAHKENIYLLHTFSVSHYTDNFRIRKDFEMHNYMSMGGWQSFSPVERERAEFLGISDMEEALYRGENVYAISREDTSYIEQCLEAKYGSCHSEEVEVIKFKDDTYRIERFGEYKEIYNSV